jgi:hypothetical protein
MKDVYTHIGEILARNARMYPNDVALIERVPAEKKRWEITWKQFDDRANQFSNALVKKGVKKDDKVAHKAIVASEGSAQAEAEEREGDAGLARPGLPEVDFLRLEARRERGHVRGEVILRLPELV